jgi:general secretion pathway protein D
VNGIDFAALDHQPVYSIVLLLSPENQPQQHLQAMNTVFTNLQKDLFRRFLRQSATKQSIIELLEEAELLAKPQLRISEGQKAQLLIGDKVPIPVSTFQSVGAPGGGVGGAVTSPVTSFQYQDVGIKIEVEPRVHHNKEVTLKLQLEVSQLNGNYPGTTQPVIGTRTIGANIRLKDGETNFLAGLFRTDKAHVNKTIPFIGDIPILGR